MYLFLPGIQQITNHVPSSLEFKICLYNNIWTSYYTMWLKRVKATPILEGIFTVDLPKIWSSPVLQNQSQGNHLDYETADYPVVDSMSLLPVSPHKENTRNKDSTIRAWEPAWNRKVRQSLSVATQDFPWYQSLVKVRREPWFAHASADIQSAISDQNLFSQL